MTTHTWTYDPTGILPANLIANEVQSIESTTGGKYRYILPKMAPFFAGGLKDVTLVSSGMKLVEGADYILGHSFDAAGTVTSKQVNGSIIFINGTLTGDVSFSYQILGGVFSQDLSGVLLQGADFALKGISRRWHDIATKPKTFPPSWHEVSWDDIVVGFKDVELQLRSIANTLASAAGTARVIDVDKVVGLKPELQIRGVNYVHKTGIFEAIRVTAPTNDKVMIKFPVIPKGRVGMRIQYMTAGGFAEMVVFGEVVVGAAGTLTSTEWNSLVITQVCGPTAVKVAATYLADGSPVVYLTSAAGSFPIMTITVSDIWLDIPKAVTYTTDYAITMVSGTVHGAVFKSPTANLAGVTGTRIQLTCGTGGKYSTLNAALASKEVLDSTLPITITAADAGIDAHVLFTREVEWSNVTILGTAHVVGSVHTDKTYAFTASAGVVSPLMDLTIDGKGINTNMFLATGYGSHIEHIGGAHNIGGVVYTAKLGSTVDCSGSTTDTIGTLAVVGEYCKLYGEGSSHNAISKALVVGEHGSTTVLTKCKIGDVKSTVLSAIVLNGNAVLDIRDRVLTGTKTNHQIAWTKLSRDSVLYS